MKTQAHIGSVSKCSNKDPFVTSQRALAVAMPPLARCWIPPLRSPLFFFSFFLPSSLLSFHFLPSFFYLFFLLSFLSFLLSFFLFSFLPFALFSFPSLFLSLFLPSFLSLVGSRRRKRGVSVGKFNFLRGSICPSVLFWRLLFGIINHGERAPPAFPGMKNRGAENGLERGSFN